MSKLAFQHFGNNLVPGLCEWWQGATAQVNRDIGSGASDHHVIAAVDNSHHHGDNTSFDWKRGWTCQVVTEKVVTGIGHWIVVIASKKTVIFWSITHWSLSNPVEFM